VITASLILFAVGLGLSAFFSGSETGFYRVARVRLLLDGLEGDYVSRALLWLTNNPALFVATTLVGNNLANYLTSLAVVLAVRQFPLGEHLLTEIIPPVLLSPVVFVYGESLPKNLFFHAPNLLLRRGAVLFLFCTVLFSPISAILWVLGRFLEWLVGEPPLRVRPALARKELQQVLDEGHEAGILRPAQRGLARSLFASASRPISDFSTPLGRMPKVRLGSPKSELLSSAKRLGVAAVPVLDKAGKSLVGYVRVVELYLDDSATIDSVRTLPAIPSGESQIAAVILMETLGEDLARIVDDDGRTLGLLSARHLTKPLFRGT
jgi:CBS domain containing-hemolysin-like protein